MLCPSDVLIDYIARNAPFTIAVCNLICESFIGEKTTALCEAKGPARRHDRFAGKAHILGHYLLVILSEDEIIYHLTVRSLKAIVVTAFCTELELGLVSIVIVIILLVVSLFIIANTVRITMFSRSLEISIMKAVGATNWFIRWPFIVEGVIIGLLSALCAFGLVSGLYFAAEKVLATMFAILGNTMVPFKNCATTLIITFATTGIVTGAMGSFISLGRYLKEHGKVVNND